MILVHDYHLCLFSLIGKNIEAAFYGQNHLLFVSRHTFTEGREDLAIEAGDADKGVSRVDNAVTGRVEAIDKSSHRRRFPRAYLPRNHADAPITQEKGPSGLQ